MMASSYRPIGFREWPGTVIILGQFRLRRRDLVLIHLELEGDTREAAIAASGLTPLDYMLGTMRDA